MIKQNLVLTKDTTVLSQILKAHDLNYSDFAKKLGISPRVLLNYRSGEREFKLNMAQLKTINQLLEPFEVTVMDLPNDWILEGESRLSHK